MALFRTHTGLLLSALALNCATLACGSSDSGSGSEGAMNWGGSAGATSAGASGTSAGSTSTSAGAGASAGSNAGSGGGAGVATGGSSGTNAGGSSSSGAGGSAGAPPLLVWPNDTSFANSDPWLSQHHNEIQEMHPRFLVVNFANNRKLSDVQARFETQKAWMMEGTRYHGYSDPNAKPFLIYELAKLVDLSDPDPSVTPLPNSTKMPRRAKNGGNDIDYSQLFNQTYADYYGIPDPNNASHNLTLCELFAKGIVNDIFLVVNKTAPDDQMPEILEYKQEYDDKDVLKPGKFDQYAGNGFFDPGDIPAVNACGRSVRIGFLEMTGVLGNSMQVNGHNYEHIGQRAVLHFDEMFKPFANFDMDTRYGTSFSDWYGQCSTSDNTCISYPDQNSVTFKDNGVQRTINPFNQGCGNAHFPPNARSNYDQTNTFTTLSTCEHYGLFDGPDGKDTQTPYNVHTLDKWKDTYGVSVVGGAWYMYWFESWPGVNNQAKMPDGTPMRNWWVYLYY
jgi:hypothetical protein